MRHLLLSACLLMAVSPTAAAQAPGDQARPTELPAEERQIRQVLGGFLDAWNTHDAKAFSLVFATDADFTNVRGTQASGRAEVERFHAPRFATNFKDSHQTMTKVKIRFIKPDVAAVDAWWETTGARNAEGQDIALRKGLLNFIMTKEAGRWVIAVMHNMDLSVAP